MPDLSNLTLFQKMRYQALQQANPEVNRRDLICPDCGGRLFLKLSKYGRFYGCENWPRIGCGGKVGAHDDGTPRGAPVASHSREKSRRRRAMAALSDLEFPIAHLQRRRRIEATLGDEILDTIITSDPQRDSQLRSALWVLLSPPSSEDRRHWILWAEGIEGLIIDLCQIVDAREAPIDLQKLDEDQRARLLEFLMLRREPHSIHRELRIQALLP